MKTVTNFRILGAALAMVLAVTNVSAEDELADPVDSASSVKNARAQRDRLDLDTTSVTGNQELPKVLYIVPWKESAIGDLAGSLAIGDRIAVRKEHGLEPVSEIAADGPNQDAAGVAAKDARAPIGPSDTKDAHIGSAAARVGA